MESMKAISKYYETKYFASVDKIRRKLKSIFSRTISSKIQRDH